MARNLLDSIELLANASRLLAEKCVDGIEANRERNEQYAESTLSAATALNPLHRLRQGDRDREGGDRVRPLAARGRARGRRGRVDPRRGARLPRDGQAARLEDQLWADGARRRGQGEAVAPGRPGKKGRGERVRKLLVLSAAIAGALVLGPHLRAR